MAPKEPLVELCAVLGKFPVFSLEGLMVERFPEVRDDAIWSDLACAREESCRPPSSRMVAHHLCELLREARCPQERILSAVEVLRLIAAYSHGLKNWHVFELTHRKEEEAISVIESIGLICSKVGRALEVRVRGVRGPDDSIILGIGNRGQKLIVAIHYYARCLLVTSVNKLYMEKIADVLGFCSIKDCHLFGRHPPSLLRMLGKKRGACAPSALMAHDVTPKSDDRGPSLTGRGLYFGKRSFDNILDEEENQIRLQSLTVQSEAQLPDLRCRLVLTSKDVISSVKDMVNLGYINEDHVFCELIRKSRNEVTVRFED